LRSQQGGSVFHKAEDAKEALGIPGEISSGFGDVQGFVPSTESDHRVPRGREDLRPVAGLNAAGIFCEGLVADPVQPVFDAPVAALIRQQLTCVSLIARQGRDAIGDFPRRLQVAGLAVTEGACPCDAKDLGDARPAELLQEMVERCRGLQPTGLASSMSFVVALGQLSLSPPLPLLRGGKRLRLPQQTHWKSQLSASADCPSP